VPWDRPRRPGPEELLAILRENLAPFGGLTGRIRDTYIDDPAAIVFRPEEYLRLGNAPVAGRRPGRP
jgi:hypothetical protein